MKRLFKCITFAIFFTCLGLLVYFQTTNLLQEDESASERFADRLGAEVKDEQSDIIAAGEGVQGLSLYLSFETDIEKGEDIDIYLNGSRAGNMRGGVLRLRVNDGDEITITSREPGVRVRIAEYPENLDEHLLPDVVSTDAGGTTPFGTVSFR